MQPKTLSASAASMFETCEARYKASYIDRASDIQNDAANLGSCCHEVLELWVKTEQYLQEWPDIMVEEKALKTVYDMVYPEYFPDRAQYADGWGMLRGWLQRIDWEGKAVLSTEEKKSFEIPTSRGPLTLNYIIDRLDQNYDGSIEVVDYKSVRQPITYDQLKNLIQTRVYATATMIEFKDQVTEAGVWVTYDLLRYGTVSAHFTREDCVVTYKYLKNLAERIYASDGTRETLNPECRFCVRKQSCETLRSNVDSGGVLSIGTLEEASDRLAILSYQKNGLEQAISELQDAILTMAENEGVHEWETGTTAVKITAKGRRNVDSGRAAQILGPDIMARYGKVGVGDVEAILETEELTDNQRSQLKQLMKKKFGAPYVTVKPKSPFSEE